MTYTISKDFSFSASHQLEGLPEHHPCTRLHGHNYTVRVELTGELDATGMVLDYAKLAPFADWLDLTLDHRHLNDCLVNVNPTAENLASQLVCVVGACCDLPAAVTVRVGVSETPKTWAWATA